MKNNPKLINFTTQDFMSEKELELASLRWDQVKESYYSRLKKLGLLRFVSLKIWNKENIARLGFVFEYKDEKAYKNSIEEIVNWRNKHEHFFNKINIGQSLPSKF